MAWMKVVALLLWSHITQRPFRTGLTIVGVALGVAASVAVIAVDFFVSRLLISVFF